MPTKKPKQPKPRTPSKKLPGPVHHRVLRMKPRSFTEVDDYAPPAAQEMQQSPPADYVREPEQAQQSKPAVDYAPQDSEPKPLSFIQRVRNWAHAH